MAWHISLPLLFSLAVAGCGGATSAQNVSAPTAPAPQQNAQTHKQAAVDMLELLPMEKVLSDAIDTALNSQITANPELAAVQDIMRDFMGKYMSWQSLKGEMAELYVEAFTEDELRELARFYTTPTGLKTIEALPKLMQEGARIGQERVQAHLPELTEAITKRMAEQAP